MANICNNELRIYSEDPKTIEYVLDFFNKHFPYYDADKIDDENLTIQFESKWDFPELLMIDLAKGLPDKTANLVCLSVEWGNLYTAFHYYNGEHWVYE